MIDAVRDMKLAWVMTIEMVTYLMIGITHDMMLRQMNTTNGLLRLPHCAVRPHYSLRPRLHEPRLNFNPG